MDAYRYRDFFEGLFGCVVDVAVCANDHDLLVLYAERTKVIRVSLALR